MPKIKQGWFPSSLSAGLSASCCLALLHVLMRAVSACQEEVLDSCCPAAAAATAATGHCPRLPHSNCQHLHPVQGADMAPGWCMAGCSNSWCLTPLDAPSRLAGIPVTWCGWLGMKSTQELHAPCGLTPVMLKALLMHTARRRSSTRSTPTCHSPQCLLKHACNLLQVASFNTPLPLSYAILLQARQTSVTGTMR